MAFERLDSGVAADISRGKAGTGIGLIFNAEKLPTAKKLFKCRF